MKKMLTKKEIKEVLDILLEQYPDAKAELDHSNPFELLVATILSAQCTDVRVNKITKELFSRVKTPQDYIDLGEKELGKIIYSCGFYRVKSENIIKTCKILRDDYGNKVPETIKELMTLPGVGKKTANVVASNAFGVPAIAVDTHVFRVSNRIGLAASDNVEKTEEDLMENIEKNMWTKGHHLLIFHGRRVCKARSPLCEQCRVKAYCLDYNEERN